MKFVLSLIFLVGASTVDAQTIVVRSGEHDGFTRLVFAMPELDRWTVFKTDEGYTLRIAEPKPTFDLTDVYRRITKERVAQVVAVPESGDLALVINCDCYAMPFEFGTGMLVIDIKDGEAPEGSAFELAADGSAYSADFKEVTSQAALRPKATGRDIERSSLPSLPTAISKAARISNTDGPVLETDLVGEFTQGKKDLLWQLSKGVADGSVEPTGAFEIVAPPVQREGQANMRIGSDLGMLPNIATRPDTEMTGNGQDCISSQQVDMAAWLPENQTDIVAEIAPYTTGLVGEFDRPDQSAIEQAIRFYLALGFGAEARLVVKAFKLAPPDRAIWETLSYIVDLDLPPGDVFSDMEVCTTNAALWSILSATEMPPPSQVAIPAVLRAFSELPLHLRRLLGPGLATRFLARNDTQTARAIRDAILRAPGDVGPEVQLMEAEIAIVNGETQIAEDLLSPLSGGSNLAGLKATAALIHSKVDLGEEVSLELVTTAEALLHEARGGQDEADIATALALGYATQNRFTEAFNMAAQGGDVVPALWSVLANRGSDEALLTWAILQKPSVPPAVEAGTATKIAKRLLDLGFPDPALLWINPISEESEAARNDMLFLAAEAELSLNRVPEAFARLKELDGEQATRLRAKILAAMRPETAVEYLSASGQPVEATRAAKQTQNWAELSTLEPTGIWRDAAALTLPLVDGTSARDPLLAGADTPLQTMGPLAQTRKDLAESVSARKIIDELLAN